MTGDDNWRPAATAATLQLRARLLQAARNFFAARGVLEVTTPALVADTVSDPHTEGLQLLDGQWLRTSPEYHLKRLLSAYGHDIYEIGPVFRGDDASSHHQPEFTMIEWYRQSMTADQVATETVELINELLVAAGQTARPIKTQSYSEIFVQHCGFNPLTADITTIKAAAERLITGPITGLIDEPSGWLDLLAGAYVFPQLGKNCIQIVTDYPASQAMLARLDPGNPALAQRFEIFADGMELANGYAELTDAAEQAARFVTDNAVRKELAKPRVNPDQRLLAALEAGLPECAGVALGFDRLIMLAADAAHIREVSSFLPGR